MSVVDHVAALRGENEAFHSAIDPTRLGSRVPSCPDWSLADLVWHLGEVRWFWGSIAEHGLTDPEQAGATVPERPEDPEELVRWSAESGDRVVRILAEADPTTEVWTWAPQKDIAFIRRRMAQETAVHRWDAQATLGTPQPVDATLAVDGIDEFLSFFLPYALSRSEPFEGSVHLHCTDVDGEWSIAPGGVVSSGHAKADAALRGPASNLLLVLWRRLSPEDVEVVGDAGAAKQLVDRLKVE